MQVSVDGLLCCTISNDQSVKIYDVVNYDMMLMIHLPFIPGAAEWVYKQGDVKAKLAISDRNSSFVHIYDARADSNEPIISKEVSCCRIVKILQDLYLLFSYPLTHNVYILSLSLFDVFLFCIFQIHLGPVKVMRFNPVFDTVISADDRGIIEYWSPETLKFPESEYVLMYLSCNHYHGLIYGILIIVYYFFVI